MSDTKISTRRQFGRILTALKQARLHLMKQLELLILKLADISEIVPQTE